MENSGAPSHLLDDAVGALAGRFVAVEDSVENGAAFFLHHLLKRSLSPLPATVVIFVSFANHLSHYDRILRKLGCSLAAQRDSKRFFFFDMLMWEYPGEKIRDEEKTSGGGLIALYGEIQKVINDLPQERKNSVSIMIDDVSFMEVADKGSTNLVLDFLHYCNTLTFELDIYMSTERPTLILQMEYMAGVIIKAEPLATGLAKDVHGQLTVVKRGNDGQ